MYKVILVDDERPIRQGVRAIVDWARHGFEVVGEAGNGREALLLHQQLKPDLMVVDIRMPGMDGLQLIEAIRKLDADCHFIVVSGYADFTYAKQAITWGVGAYLLKPVDEVEIANELGRIGELLAAAGESRSLASTAVAQRRERLIVSLLTDTNGMKHDAVPWMAIEELNWSAYQVLLLKLLPHEGSNGDKLANVKARLAKRFDERQAGAVFALGLEVGILLKDTGRIAIQGKQLYEELEQSLEGLGVTFAAAAGKLVKRIEEIGDSYLEASDLLKEEFLYRGDRTIIAKHSKFRQLAGAPSGAEPPAPDIRELADKLFFAVDLGSRDAVRRLLKEGLQDVAAYDASEQAIKTAVSQWISLALAKLSGQSNVAHTAVQFALPIVADIYLQPAFRSLELLLEDKLLQLVERLGASGSEPAVKQMLDIIERHYAENITLETLGELLNYNSGYLGKMFKSFTGDTFHTHLDKVRIRNAKALLEGGLKVHQAAVRVGYANADYFHLKFKKYFGESPSRYKAKPQSQQ